jgi:hypothetical protein
LASHNSLPPYTQSSVLAWWLAFGQAGLSSLLTSAYLGAPIYTVKKHIFLRTMPIILQQST